MTKKRTRKKTDKPKSTRRVSGRIATSKPEVKRRAERELMVTKKPKPPAPKKALGWTAIQSAWPGRLIISGAPSGRRYVWNDAGHINSVALDDVEFIMGKNRSKARECCGPSGRTYFILAE